MDQMRIGNYFTYRCNILKLRQLLQNDNVHVPKLRVLCTFREADMDIQLIVPCARSNDIQTRKVT